jgi:hypothetical protein
MIGAIRRLLEWNISQAFLKPLWVQESGPPYR